MTRSSRNRILRRNAQRSERSDNMGAIISINEIKPCKVHKESKHIDKIIGMATEIDRDNMDKNERAHREIGNQWLPKDLCVVEPYLLTSSDPNILSRWVSR
jgi:hypothetical protein